MKRSDKKIRKASKSTKKNKSLEYVEHKSKRIKGFAQRKKSMFKKAFELTTLTGCELLMMVHDKDNKDNYLYQTNFFKKYNAKYPKVLPETFAELTERAPIKKKEEKIGKSKKNCLDVGVNSRGIPVRSPRASFGTQTIPPDGGDSTGASIGTQTL